MRSHWVGRCSVHAATAVAVLVLAGCGGAGTDASDSPATAEPKSAGAVESVTESSAGTADADAPVRDVEVADTASGSTADDTDSSQSVAPTGAATDETSDAGSRGPAVALPEGFPTGIPLPDLPIASATALTTTKGWIVNFVADDLPGEMEKAHLALAEAGFVDEHWTPDSGSGLVKGDTYHVQVMLTPAKSWISFAIRTAT